MPPLPATPDTMPGLIFDMPLKGIDHYVEQKLSSTVVSSDADLVVYLDARLADGAPMLGLTPSLARLEQTLKDSKLFAELSEEVKISLITRLHRPRDATADPKKDSYA